MLASMALKKFWEAPVTSKCRLWRECLFSRLFRIGLRGEERGEERGEDRRRFSCPIRESIGDLGDQDGEREVELPPSTARLSGLLGETRFRASGLEGEAFLADFDERSDSLTLERRGVNDGAS